MSMHFLGHCYLATVANNHGKQARLKIEVEPTLVENRFAFFLSQSDLSSYQISKYTLMFIVSFLKGDNEEFSSMYQIWAQLFHKNNNFNLRCTFCEKKALNIKNIRAPKF